MQQPWHLRNETLPANRGLRFIIERSGQLATYQDVLDGWLEDPDFRVLFSQTLAQSPFTAFRWETPAVTAGTLIQPFEFVLLDSPALTRRSEPEAFAEHFKAGSTAEVVVFPNLGGDAVMIVPCPVASSSVYGHLAAFLRTAPETQKHALWTAVAEAMRARVNSKPVWLNTAGAGVAWLHVRLDDRPKYYGFDAYRRSSSG